MKINKTIIIVIVILITAVLALTALSQILSTDTPLPDNQFKNSIISLVNDKISVEEKQDYEIK